VSANPMVIEVRGGLVQAVYGSHPDLAVILVDWDCEESDSPQVVTIESAQRRTQAYVVELPLQPLTVLAGSELEQLLAAAEEGVAAC